MSNKINTVEGRAGLCTVFVFFLAMFQIHVKFIMLIFIFLSHTLRFYRAAWNADAVWR